jgi:hypothetical protein
MFVRLTRLNFGDILGAGVTIVIRNAHRSMVARIFAWCLLALAISPVTPPFTAFELSDLYHSLPADTSHHTGREMAEPHAKVASHLVVAAPEMTPAEIVAFNDADNAPLSPRTAVTSPGLPTVLRL